MQRIRGGTIMRYINLLFTYLLTYLTFAIILPKQIVVAAESSLSTSCWDGVGCHGDRCHSIFLNKEKMTGVLKMWIIICDFLTARKYRAKVNCSYSDWEM